MSGQKAENECFAYYGCGAAPAIKRDFFPCDNEHPSGREGRHVLEVLPDVLGGPFQDDGVHGLPVVDLTPDSVVHICPEWGNEGTAISQWEGFWRELAHKHIEGHDAIIVDLQE